MAYMESSITYNPGSTNFKELSFLKIPSRGYAESIFPTSKNKKNCLQIVSKKLCSIVPLSS